MRRLVDWDTPRKMFVTDLAYLDANRRELDRALA
jgi:hypothetical protein